MVVMKYLNYSNYLVDEVVYSVEDLVLSLQGYELVLLSGNSRALEDIDGSYSSIVLDQLENLKMKSEVVCTSSMEDFVELGRKYGKLFPVSKPVRLKEDYSRLNHASILTISDDELHVYQIGYEVKDLRKMSVAFAMDQVNIWKEYNLSDPEALLMIRHKKEEVDAIKNFYGSSVFVSDMIFPRLKLSDENVDTIRYRKH